MLRKVFEMNHARPFVILRQKKKKTWSLVYLQKLCEDRQ